MELKEKTVSSDNIFEGKIIRVRVDRVKLPDGNLSNREIVEHPGAVAVVPLTDTGRVLMVCQYRKPVEKVLLEIPAGKLEKQEELEICARRELEEETGKKARNLKKLGSFYTSPGYSNEKMTLFLATGLMDGLRKPEKSEFINLVSVPLAEAISYVEKGKIEDAKTIIGLLAVYCLERNKSF